MADHLNRLVGAEYWDELYTAVEKEIRSTIDVFGNRIEKKVDASGDGIFESVLRTAYLDSMA